MDSTLPARPPAPANPPVPSTVVAAQVLMWLHFVAVPCLLAAMAMAVLFRMADVESGPMTGDEAIAIALVGLSALLIPAAVLTLIGILAVKLLRGRRWARTTTLVFNGIWIVLGLVTLLIGLASPGAIVQPLLTIGFEGAIALCLCTPSAKAWFGHSRSESEAAPVATSAEVRRLR